MYALVFYQVNIRNRHNLLVSNDFDFQSIEQVMVFQ
jgi:hypothetical protein